MVINKQNNRHTISPQTHIVFIMPCPKGISSRHKSGTGKNQGTQQTNPHDNRGFNCNDYHSKSNKLSLPVIYVSPTLNNSVINPYQLSLVCQHSSISSHNTSLDSRCFNIKYSNSKNNELPSPVIPMRPQLNDSIINPTHLSSVCHQSSNSSHITTHELQASSIPVRTSPDPSNTMPPPSTNNVRRNIYVCMIDVSNLTPSQLQQHALMLLNHHHKLCNTNDPASMFVSRILWYETSFII